MAKKTKAEKKASASGLFDSALAGTVKESAQQIWLAGLGAFSKAQQEGGKVFEALVKDGVSLQRKTQEAASAKLGEVGARVTGAAEEATGKAGQQWDKLESIFEQRVTRAMGHLGVPSQQDFEALLARVDALSEEVRELSKARQAKPKAPTRKAAPDANATKPARKPAAKRAARKAT